MQRSSIAAEQQRRLVALRCAGRRLPAVHLKRRDFLRATSVSTALAAFPARAAEVLHTGPVPPPSALEFRTLRFETTTMYRAGVTAIAAVPRGLPRGERLPMCVLLPGGEHTMQKRDVGVWGFWSDFGLGEADTALRSGKLSARDFNGFGSDDDVASWNRSLSENPYRGLIIVTPWVLRRQSDLRPHGAMLLPFLRQLVERARSELPALASRGACGLGGVSAGGLWALWAGAQLADLFGAIVAVQPYTDGYERTLRDHLKARKTSQSLRIISSRGDALFSPNRRLVEQLDHDGIHVETASWPGPHAPSFVRGPGSLELLRSFDRTLEHAAAAVSPVAAASGSGSTTASAASAQPSSASAPATSASASTPSAKGAAPSDSAESRIGFRRAALGTGAVVTLTGIGAWLARRRTKHDPPTSR